MKTKGLFHKWVERTFLMYQEMYMGLNSYAVLLEVIRSLKALYRWLVVL
jgi:hypothetical protein